MLWIVFACLVAGAVVAISAPLFRRGTDDPLVGNLDAYVALLREVDRDEERGLLSREQAEETRAEVARRLLKFRGDGARAPSASTAADSRRPAYLFAGVAAFLAVSSMGIYLAIGHPGLPAQPLSARLQGPVDSQSIDVLVARVERRLAETPEDGMGWAVLAPIYFKQGQFDRAAESYRRALSLLGENTERLLGLAEASTYLANGVVTSEAADAFNKALRRDPASIRARFWLATRLQQEGKTEDAERAFTAIVADESIPEAWRLVINTRLSEMRGAAPPGGQQRAAAAESPAGAPPEFIRNMVESLAARLQDDGSDLNGWLMLMRSYATIGEQEKAKSALASARTVFENSPDSLRQLDDLAKSLGLI
jgi:cytochrome c-type biogenesis protein CcmH